MPSLTNGAAPAPAPLANGVPKDPANNFSTGGPSANDNIR